MAQRSYSRIQGTINLLDVYGVNRDRDAQLKNLIDLRTGVKYTAQSAKDNFPALWGYLQVKGFTDQEFLNLYEFECAWLDAVWSCDTYIGYPAVYTRPGNVTQSRAWIQAPDGWFRIAFGCMTGLGRYSGKHAQVYGESTGGNVGSTPGTAIVTDHANWSPKQPQRNGIFASAWGQDFGQIGGLAYSEGVIVEYFRVVGGMSQKDPSFTSYGITGSHPGENSSYRFNMVTNMNDDGYAIIGGTPGLMDTNSAFYNNGYGFGMRSNNALTNMNMITPSGDNNRKGLIGIMAMDGQSVSGGEFVITGLKAEGRGQVHKAVVVEAPMGLLSLTINGATVACDQTQPELFEINSSKGNGQFASWQVDVRGLLQVGNANAMLTDKGTGKTYKVGGPYQPMSFCITDAGIVSSSRTSDPPVGGSTGGGTTPPVDPPPTGSIVATASVPSATEQGVLREPKYMVDGVAGTYWMGLGGMTNGQKVTITFPAVRKAKGLTFKMPTGYSNSFPKKFEVRASTGGAFTSLGNFTGAATSTATWTERDVLVLEIICREANPSAYWGISEVTFQ
jgi:hypothetical protein